VTTFQLYLSMYSTEISIISALVLGAGIGALVMRQHLRETLEERIGRLEAQRQPRAANGRYVRRLA
jgi:hypothetical protein